MAVTFPKERNWAAPFFTLWSVQALSLFGSSLVQFAIIWWLTASTGSATVLATATIVGMLPGILLGPLAGACVDRWNRRATMLIADGLCALAILALVALHAAGLMQIWHIYVVMLVRSAAGTFHWPAMQASTSLMVPEAHLPRVAGMNQTLQGVANIITPPLGAILISALPLYGVMSIDVVTAAIAMGTLFFIAVPQPAARTVSATARPASVLHDMRDGLRYLMSWKALMVLFGVSMLVNLLLTPAFSLTPILVVKYFGGDALKLAWMNSCFGVGIITGGLMLSAWGGFRRRTVTMRVGLAGIGLGTLLVGLTPAHMLPLALVGMFTVGFMMPMCNAPFFALLQSNVDASMQGRVFGLTMTLSGGIAPLGMALAGPLADRFGVSMWFVAAGLLCLAVVATPVLSRSIASLDQQREPAPAVEAVLHAASAQ